MTTAIFENSSKLLACVASVSNRVIARKLERKQKKDWRGRGRGEEEEVPSFPSASPVIHFFFLPLSQFSRRTSRGNACYAGYEVARFSLRDVTMAKIVRTNKPTKFTPPPRWPYDTRRKQSKCIHFLDFLYFPIYSRRNYSVGTNTSFSWFQVIHFKPLTFLKNCCSKSLSTFECWVSFLDLESIKVPNNPFRMDGLALLCWQGMIHFHSGILLSA